MATKLTNIPTNPTRDQFKTFAEFYPFYLSQHSNPICRALHVVGTLSGAVLMGYYAKKERYGMMLPAALIVGYGCAWIGHFFFEKNKPATFTWPLWSFMGDWKMAFEIITLRRGLTD